jgi:hypothetical protein
VTWLEIVMLAVFLPPAVASITLLWLHGSIFAPARARWQAYGGWSAELTRCPLCVCGQVSLWLSSVLAAAISLPEPWNRFPAVMLFVCAAPLPAFLLYNQARILIASIDQQEGTYDATRPGAFQPLEEDKATHSTGPGDQTGA